MKTSNRRIAGATGGKNSLRERREKQSELKVRTPQDPELQSLAQQGLIVPDDLDPEDETVPLDFTVASSQAIGAIHSRFAVRHAHGIYLLARTRNRFLALRRQLRIEQAKFRSLHKDDFDRKYELDDEMLKSKRIARLDRQITECEITMEVQQAVVEGFLDVVKAASREMSRRSDERAPRD